MKGIKLYAILFGVWFGVSILIGIANAAIILFLAEPEFNSLNFDDQVQFIISDNLLIRFLLSLLIVILIYRRLREKPSNHPPMNV